MNPDEIARQMAWTGQITEEFADSISNQSRATRGEITLIDTVFNSDGFIFNNEQIEIASDMANRVTDQVDNTIFDSLRGNVSIAASTVSNANAELTREGFYRGLDQQDLYLDGEWIAQRTQRNIDNETTTEDLNLILDKADLYHIDLGPEAMIEALQAISKMISTDINISDGEVIDYIDSFLQKIGVR